MTGAYDIRMVLAMAHQAAEKPLTPRQVADLFSVSVTTVGSWADSGRLAYFRTPGGHRRFRRADVYALIAASQSEAAAS